MINNKSQTTDWRLWVLLYLSLIPLGSPLAAQTQTLHTSDAIHADAQLLKLDGADAWSFQLAGRETTLASSRIVRWGSWSGILSEQAVWLNDGSWLCGDIQIAGQTVTVANDWLKSPPLAFQQVRGLVLTSPTTLARWLELQSQMLAAGGEQDMLWLRGGKKLSGIIREPAAQSEQSPSRLEVEASGQRLELSLDEVEAVVFSPTLLGPIPPHRNSLQLGLVDGSLLWVAQLQPEISSVELTLDGAIKLSSLDGPRQFCKAIRSLAHTRFTGNGPIGNGTTSSGTAGNGAATRFLSELPVASYRHVSDSTLTWELGINRDVYGRALHTRQGIFSNGLATHSASQVAFRWDGSPGRLLAEVTLAAAPPQAASTLGSVNCQILLARDDKLQTVEQFSLARNSPHGRAATHLVDVELSQAKLIVLVTDKADVGQFGDHLLWLNARIGQARSLAPRLTPTDS